MRIKIDSKELYQVLDAAGGYNDEVKINLEHNGILIQVQDPSKNGLYSSFIPEDVMEEYDRGEINAIGLDLDKPLNFLPNKREDVVIKFVEHDSGVQRLQANVGNSEYHFPMLDTDSIGSAPDQVPDLDYGIHIRSDPSIIEDFIKDCKKAGAGSYHIAARHGLLYLWGETDTFEMVERIHWEDFEDYNIKWRDVNNSEKVKYNPGEDEKTDVQLSVELTKPMQFFSDEIDIYIGCYYPVKIVSESDNGVKHSWIVPPRIPKSMEDTEPPERIIKDRSVV